MRSEFYNLLAVGVLYFTDDIKSGMAILFYCLLGIMAGIIILVGMATSMGGDLDRILKQLEKLNREGVSKQGDAPKD